ncbi:MAG: ribosome silencing factor [Acidobacteriota bacterium]|jgi:ribosome-associated protein|nr:MAG: ribosome silencing factor [Acidobacteriota bacterium]
MSKTTPRTKRARQRQPAAALPDDLLAGIAAALDKKAADLVVLDLRQSQAFTDFFVICTGASTRQVQAIADGIQMALARRGTKPALVEGETRAEWILIDYFDFIFHIFTPATREFYDLERLWGDAERIEIPA